MPITTYYSGSKGQEIPLVEMEDNHLKNAILKFRREQEKGSPIPTALLDALIAEQTRRTPATKTEDTPTTNTPSVVTSPPDLAVLAARLVTVANQLTEGRLTSDGCATQLSQLADSVNQVILPVTNNPVVLDTTVRVSGDTVLATLNRGAYPALTAQLLLNSLAAYGVVTVRDLSALAPVDFGAVRYSTPLAYVEALALFREVELSWNSQSSILLRDGAINRVLNPNASDIGDFVQVAAIRLTAATDRVNRGHASSAYGIPAIERIFSGIKRRLALAVSVIGTSLLARGLPAQTAATVLAGLQVTRPFRHQVQLYLNRWYGRIMRMYPTQVTDSTEPVITQLV